MYSHSYGIADTFTLTWYRQCGHTYIPQVMCSNSNEVDLVINSRRNDLCTQNLVMCLSLRWLGLELGHASSWMVTPLLLLRSGSGFPGCCWRTRCGSFCLRTFISTALPHLEEAEEEHVTEVTLRRPVSVLRNDRVTSTALTLKPWQASDTLCQQQL